MLLNKLDGTPNTAHTTMNMTLFLIFTPHNKGDKEQVKKYREHLQNLTFQQLRRLQVLQNGILLLELQQL